MIIISEKQARRWGKIGTWIVGTAVIAGLSFGTLIEEEYRAQRDKDLRIAADNAYSRVGLWLVRNEAFVFFDPLIVPGKPDFFVRHSQENKEYRLEQAARDIDCFPRGTLIDTFVLFPSTSTYAKFELDGEEILEYRAKSIEDKTNEYWWDNYHLGNKDLRTLLKENHKLRHNGNISNRFTGLVDVFHKAWSEINSKEQSKEQSVLEMGLFLETKYLRDGVHNIRMEWQKFGDNKVRVVKRVFFLEPYFISSINLSRQEEFIHSRETNLRNTYVTAEERRKQLESNPEYIKNMQESQRIYEYQESLKSPLFK